MSKPTPVAEAQAEKKRRRTVEPPIVEDGGVADGLFDDFVSPFRGGTVDSQAEMLERMQTVQRQDLAVQIGYAQGNRHLQRVIAALRQGRPMGPESARRPAGVQTKLTVSEPDDQYEQEADQVADRVMKMPAPAPPPPPDADGDNGDSPQTPIAQRLSLRPADPAPASAAVLRPALTVGEPDDQYEQEADEVGEAVQRMPFFAPPPHHPTTTRATRTIRPVNPQAPSLACRAAAARPMCLPTWKAESRG